MPPQFEFLTVSPPTHRPTSPNTSSDSHPDYIKMDTNDDNLGYEDDRFFLWALDTLFDPSKNNTVRIFRQIDQIIDIVKDMLVQRFKFVDVSITTFY